MIKDRRLDNYARRCAFCDAWASGSWGTFEGSTPPETGELYTCAEHWYRLYDEADAAAKRHDGDVSMRPMYIAGLVKVGMMDGRSVQDFPDGTKVITRG